MSENSKLFVRACILAQLDWEARSQGMEPDPDYIVLRADELIDEVERVAAVGALEEAAQSYPFTLMGVGATWHEAQKVLCERAVEIRKGKLTK